MFSNGITDFLGDQSSEPGKPKAYINWILFDEQFKFERLVSGFEQAGADNSFTIHALDNLDVIKSGYLYIYVSNVTPNINVFFDNLQVTHIRGPIVEETHYYPGGLVMSGISSKSLNFGNPTNKLKHAGKELHSQEFSDGSGLELYDFHARNYDPQLMRWHNLDPLADSTYSLSPYNYVANNPLIFIDPDGREIKPAGDQEKEYYDRIYKNADKKTKANLDRMQKSKVVYNIKFDDVMGKYGKEGTVDFSKADKGELTLLVDGEGSEYNKIAALGDELEHGRQFEDGEIGALKGKDGQSGIAAYDQKDEAKSQDAAVAALKSNGFELKGAEADWVNAKANGTQADFFTKYSYQFQVPSGTNANTRYAGANGKTFLKNNPQLESVVYRKNGKTYVVKR